MAKVLAAAVILVACVALRPTHADDFADLSQLLLNAHNYWPEGATECEVSGRACSVNGVEQSYKVRAYWKNRRYRFEYEPLNAKQQPASAGWVVIGGGEGFRFMKNSGTALVAHTPDPSRTERYLQVLPNMAWLNITMGTSFSDWLNKTVPKLDHSVSKDSNGSYRLSIKGNGVELAFAEFTRQGLPTAFREINRQPGKSVRFSEIEWLDVDDEKFPHPVKLVHGADLGDGRSVTLLEINVSEFRTKLKPTDPSFAIPPVDLPLGTPIRDMR